MKLKLLRGVVYNACDKVSGGLFQYQYLSKIELPRHGEWVVDLKAGEARDGKGKPVELPFSSEFREWFLREIGKAGVPVEAVESATMSLSFDFPANKSIVVRTDVKVAGRHFVYKKSFRPLGF